MPAHLGPWLHTAWEDMIFKEFPYLEFPSGVPMKGLVSGKCNGQQGPRLSWSRQGRWSEEC